MTGILVRFRRRIEAVRHLRRARRLMHWGRRAEAVIELAQTVEGDLQPAEIALLYRVTRRSEGPGHIAQVGIWRGRATAVMAMARADADADATLFAIDPMDGDRNGLDALRANLRRLGLTQRLEVMVAEPARAAEALKLRGEMLRLLFLDGAGSYEETVSQIRVMLPLLRDGGLVVLQRCVPNAESPDVWLAFQDELSERVEIVERTGRMLVSRLPAAVG